MSWIWMHIPLVEVIFTATAAASLWMVINYPESGAARRGRSPGQLITVPADDRQPRPQLRRGAGGLSPDSWRR